MKNFCYNVNTYAENEELTFRTNDIRHALDDFFESANEGVHVDIVNGFTGEVLAIANHPEGESHVTDEMALMMTGYLAEQARGEEDEDDEEEETGSIVDFLEEMVAQGKAVKLGGLPS